MTAISRQDYKALLAGAHRPKVAKYKNHRVVEAKADGTTITHDSKKEAKHWHYLRHLETAGEIADLKRQERFALNVLGHKIATYVADFTYLRRMPTTGAWMPVVVDVKSFATRKLPVYRMKLKLMKAIYGIEIEEVM